MVAQEYEVAVARRSGEEAIEKLRRERFDLVLLDVNMPGIGGLEACREIRASSDAAIIMLTVRGSEQDKVDALDAGADDYVTKPFSTPELLARHSRRPPSHAPLASDSNNHTLAFDDLEIQFATRRVVVRGKPIRLTPKEFDLLHYLATNPNIPIPHGKLLQAVWGPDYGHEVEYLRVFINQLRKKLEPNPAKPRYLLTEPWVGYRFEIPMKSNP